MRCLTEILCLPHGNTVFASRKYCVCLTEILCLPHGNTVFASRKYCVRSRWLWVIKHHNTKTCGSLAYDSKHLNLQTRLRWTVSFTPTSTTALPPSMEQSPSRVSQVAVPTLTELSSLTKKKNTLPTVVCCARQTHVTSHTYFYKALFNIIPHTSIPRFVK